MEGNHLGARCVNLNLPHCDSQVGWHSGQVEEQRFRLKLAEMLQQARSQSESCYI